MENRALYFGALAPVVAAVGWAIHLAHALRELGSSSAVFCNSESPPGCTMTGTDCCSLPCSSAPCNLWYRPFPNWRIAILAAVAGVFYGLAYRQARSIRASMVTHALTVTAWRLFFT